MVLGSILNWIVGKSLDMTFDSIWWITKKTGQGFLNAGYYIIITRNQNDNDKDKDNNENIMMDEINKDLITISKEELMVIKEQNKLLKEEIKLLQKEEIK
jgi:hypothetical protein